jgi:hypothetical protein
VRYTSVADIPPRFISKAKDDEGQQREENCLPKNESEMENEEKVNTDDDAQKKILTEDDPRTGDITRFAFADASEPLHP